MSQAIVVLGDKTNHGGTVISASSQTGTQGKAWARMGDMVSCPRCKGVFPISQGDSMFKVDGAPVAYDGCKVACGATLIASQGLTTRAPLGGAGSGAGNDASDGDSTDGVAPGFGSIGAGLVAGYQDAPVGDGPSQFQGRFQVLDRVTGEPITGKDVRVRSTGGKCLTGTTDAEGYTQWVERDASESLAFDLIDPPSDAGTQ